MAKVTLDGTINMQGTKKISPTNLAHLREPAFMTGTTVAALQSHLLSHLQAGVNGCACEPAYDWPKGAGQHT